MRNEPYTITELDEQPSGKFLDKFLGNIKFEWKSKLSVETIAQIESGKLISDGEFQQMRGNSYDCKTRYPLLDNDALIKRVQHALDNSGVSDKGRYCIDVTYTESLTNSLVPLLMDRLEQVEEELNKVKKDGREAINTTWRFIGAYKKENAVSLDGALKSAEYHLRKADYIFDKE